MSYREACLARGLLENDNHLYSAMTEASISHTSYCMRALLAIILTSCESSNPSRLWYDFREHLSEDFLFLHRNTVNEPEAPFNEAIFNKALCNLEDQVILLGG